MNSYESVRNVSLEITSTQSWPSGTFCSPANGSLCLQALSMIGSSWEDFKRVLVVWLGGYVRNGTWIKLSRSVEYFFHLQQCQNTFVTSIWQYQCTHEDVCRSKGYGQCLWVHLHCCRFQEIHQVPDVLGMLLPFRGFSGCFVEESQNRREEHILSFGRCEQPSSRHCSIISGWGILFCGTWWHYFGFDLIKS